MEAEKRILANAEKIYSAAINAFDLLYEGNASTSSSLRAAQKHVEELVGMSRSFRRRLRRARSARISVEDVGATLRDYAGGIQASPERLGEIEERLALLRSTEAQVWTDPAADDSLWRRDSAQDLPKWRIKIKY